MLSSVATSPANSTIIINRSYEQLQFFFSFCWKLLIRQSFIFNKGIYNFHFNIRKLYFH